MKKLLSIGAFLAGVMIALSVFVLPARAATVALSGFAWSDLPQAGVRGAGWIAFSGPTYGVVANTTTGDLSGYAWSENYGWLSFNAADVSGCPSAPCQPNVSPSDGSTTGWARFIAAPAGTGSTWNGWVHLSGSTYGVTYDGAGTPQPHFNGYAYGENYIGWIHFANNATCTIYCVTMSPLIPPTASLTITTTPASATWTINPGNISGTGSGNATVTPSQSGTLYTLTPGAAPAGYDPNPSITNTKTPGSSATIFPGEAVTYTLTYSRSFDYSLANNGSVSIQKAGIAQSGQNSVTATIGSPSGPGQAVTLSASGVPSGVSVNFSNQGCIPASGSPCSYTATFTAQPTATSGTYPITVTGSPLSKTTNFNLTIVDSPNMIASCSANPSTAKVGDDVTWSVSLTNNPNPQPPYTYSWSGDTITLPPNEPQTPSFITNYSTTGSKRARATITDSLLNQATCPDAFINIGVNPGFGEF